MKTLYVDSSAAVPGRSNCIFVTGIWKSGNHLVYTALNKLGIEGPFNGIAAHLIYGRFRMAKRLFRGSAQGIDIGLETEVRIRPCYIQYTVRKLHGRILGGHAAYSPELVALMRSEGARMIVIRRDPRDMLISFADWIERRPDNYLYAEFGSLSREHRVAKLLHGDRARRIRPFTEVLARSEGWLTEAADVLVMNFEDLVGPKGGGTIERQATALGELCDHLGRAMPHGPEWLDGIYGNSLTFNKGQVQRWRELQSSDLKSEIVEILAEPMRRWGYGPDVKNVQARGRE